VKDAARIAPPVDVKTVLLPEMRTVDKCRVPAMEMAGLGALCVLISESNKWNEELVTLLSARIAGKLWPLTVDNSTVMCTLDNGPTRKIELTVDCVIVTVTELAKTRTILLP
jgi:hypothetical protein